MPVVQLEPQAERLAAAWYNALLRGSFVAAESRSLRARVGELARRALLLLGGDPVPRAEARALGAELAGLRYVRPETAGRLVESLIAHAGADLTTGDALLDARAGVLTGELVVGFLLEHRATTLREQAAIQEAALAAQREAEEARRASERQYRAAVTQAAEGIVLSDAETRRVVEANQAFLRLVGYTAGEMEGLSLYTLIAHSPASISENIRQAVSHGQHEIGERRCRRKDGTVVTVEASTSLVETANRRLLCTVVRDVTERIRAAEELAQTRQKLAEGREAEQLRLARALHDGPVQELLGLRYQLAAGMRRAGGQRADGDLVAALQEAQDGLAAVVCELRGLIRDLRPVGVDDLGLEAALHHYLSALGQAGAGLPEISVQADCGVRRLPQATSLCLFRAAQESIRNALNHAGARSIVVRVRTRPQTAVLRVSDDGCGFAVPERLDSLARANHFGLIGLAERVGWAGGRLRVRSRPGRGTTVTVWAPLPPGPTEGR